MLPVGLAPCSIPSMTESTCHNYDDKKPIKTEDGAKCRAGILPALHSYWAGMEGWREKKVKKGPNPF